LDDNNKI